MSDQLIMSGLQIAGGELYAAQLVKQAANLGAVAGARRAKARAAQGLPPVTGRTSWEGTRPKMQASIKAAKPPVPAAPMASRPALPAPSSGHPTHVITPAEISAAPKTRFPRTPSAASSKVVDVSAAHVPGGPHVSGAAHVGEAPVNALAKVPASSTALRAAEVPAAAGMSRLLRGGLLAAGLGLAGYGAYKMLKGKDKTAQPRITPGQRRMAAGGKNINKLMSRPDPVAPPPFNPSHAVHTSAPVPPPPTGVPPVGAGKGGGALMKVESTAAKGLSRSAKLGLGLGALGAAATGYGIYRLLKGKDKAAAVGQLNTAPQEGAPTPPILSKLIKELAKDHPGMAHAMPTDPGPAYPYLLKAQPGISLPLMGKAASVNAFRRLASEILPG